MTLAFELDAFKRLLTRTSCSTTHGSGRSTSAWSATAHVRRHQLHPETPVRQDFFSGPRGREESLEDVKEQFDTDRHVFVGADDEDADLAETAGWEYLPVTQAAEAADWDLGEPETPDTQLTRTSSATTGRKRHSPAVGGYLRFD